MTTVRGDEATDDADSTDVAGLEARGLLLPYRPSLLESLRECWRYRRVLRQMASQLSLFTYRQTLLGFWWIPIVVLFDTLGRAVIFGRILNVPSAYGIPYLIFLSVGTMAWWLFNRTLLFTLRSFVRFRRVTKDLYVPLALIPLASMWQTALEFGFYGLVLLGYFGVFWALEGELYLNVGPELIFAPLGYVWLLLFVLGIAFFTAPTFMRARDVRFTIRVGLPFMMYVTPIIWPLSEVGGKAGVVASLNPLTAPIETVKLGLLGIGVLPWYSVVVSLTTTIALLIGGLMFLNRHGLRLIGVETFEEDDFLE